MMRQSGKAPAAVDGPHSPKKKKSVPCSPWGPTAKDKSTSCNPAKSGGDVSKARPVVEIKCAPALDLIDKDNVEKEREAFLEIDESEDGFDESSESSYEEIVESDDDGALLTIDDDSSVTVENYTMEQATLKDESDDDEIMKPLPPPIAIRNELRPVHLREPETPLTTNSDDDTSDDDSNNSSEDRRRPSQKTDDEEASNGAAPFSLRPSAIRGHSFDNSTPAEAKIVPARGGKRESKNVSSQSPVVEEAEKEAEVTSKPPSSLRPSAVRGHSFDNSTPAAATSAPVRAGGKRETKEGGRQTGTEKKLENSSKPIPDAPETFNLPRTYIMEGDSAGGIREYTWEKPEWAKNGGPKLRSTGKADVMKTNGDLAKPITILPDLVKRDGTIVCGATNQVIGHMDLSTKSATMTTAKKSLPPIRDAPPVVQAGVRVETVRGRSIVESNDGLQGAPPVSSPRRTAKKSAFASASPSAPLPPAKVNGSVPEHNPIEWKKPDWAKSGPKLRPTGKGELLRTVGNLAKPITSLPDLAKRDATLLDSERQLDNTSAAILNRRLNDQQGARVEDAENPHAARPGTLRGYSHEDVADQMGLPDPRKRTGGKRH